MKVFDDISGANDQNDDEKKVDDNDQDCTKNNIGELKFDRVYNGKNIDFAENYKRVKGRYGWNICIADNVISKLNYNEYEWSIKCNDIGNGKFCMGFIDDTMYSDSYKDVIKDWNIWITI